MRLVSPILPPWRIYRRWTTSAKFLGKIMSPRSTGMRSSNRGPRSARFSATGSPGSSRPAPTPTSTFDAADAGALKARIVAAGNALGFDAIGFTAAQAPAHAAHLDMFLAAGRHGDMTWLAANRERRRDPRALWPEARSIIVVGLNYAPDRNPLDALLDRSRGAISVYARGLDYDDLIKAK